MKRIFVLILTVMMVFCSCSKKDDSAFPTTPDKIVVGADGVELELLPDSKEFDKVYSGICGRVEKSGGFQTASLYAYDPVTKKHLSEDLRESEAFIEFVYNESSTQTITKAEPYGETSTKEITVQKLFFPLGEEYYECFFIGNDAEYKSSSTFGILLEDTTLEAYVRELVAEK